MRKMTPVGGAAPPTSQKNVHMLIRAATLGSLVVAVILLLPKTGAGIFQRSTLLSEAKGTAMLGDTEATQATLAEFGVDSTVGHAAKPIPTNAQGDMLEEVRRGKHFLSGGAAFANSAFRSGSLSLPGLIRAVEVLKADFKNKHFVTYDPDYETFIRNVKTALDAHQLPHRVFDEIFSDTNRVTHPSCHGSWMEFGVHTGGTVKLAANWRTKYCSEKSPVVYGFDTFTGLPERWYGSFGTGVFDLKGNLPPVPANVRLVKGLFNESLPLFLEEQDMAAPGGRLANLTYVHLDMDLYAGASDVLTILNDRISPGAIVLFDELVNYPAYRDHEMLAFWEWLGRTGRTVQAIGKLGPLPNRSDAVELFPGVDLGGYHQSAGFIAL